LKYFGSWHAALKLLLPDPNLSNLFQIENKWIKNVMYTADTFYVGIKKKKMSEEKRPLLASGGTDSSVKYSVSGREHTIVYTDSNYRGPDESARNQYR
jgi:hypothetical protein